MLPQTQLQTKKIMEYTKERREYSRRKNEEYRNKRNDGYDLLREWVPGTEKLTRPQLLKKTVNYIQDLLKKINEESIMVEPQEMLPQTQKKDIKERRDYMKIRNEEYRNELKSGFNLLRKWVPGTANLGRIKLLKKTVKYIQELQNKIKDGSTMECKKRVNYIQELEHKIKELEKELFKKQENYIKELEHKENYIKELEHKIKELETSQMETALSHRSFTDLDTGLCSSEMVGQLETSQMETALSHRSFTDLDTGLCSSEMVGLTTSMEISVSSEEELLASGIPEFNSMEHFRQWLEL
jgi:hypothetical protein